MQPRSLRLEERAALVLYDRLLAGLPPVKLSELQRETGGVTLLPALTRLVELRMVLRFGGERHYLYQLSELGATRCRWLARVGVRALLGLEQPAFDVLRLLSWAREPLDEDTVEREISGDKFAKQPTKTALAQLADEGFVYDVRAWWAPGSPQPQQWAITDRGRALEACLSGARP